MAPEEWPLKEWTSLHTQILKQPLKSVWTFLMDLMWWSMLQVLMVKSTGKLSFKLTSMYAARR
jgi:hypothetical protein